jgi:hypothetical protein
MSTLSVLFDLLVTVALLWRQRRIRRVSLHLVLPIFLGFVGLLQLLRYTDHHPLSAGATAALLGLVLLGGSAAAALRASTVRVWRAQGVLPWIVRQATWTTMVLWAGSIAGYVVLAALVPTTPHHGVVGPAYLLFLAFTAGAQRVAERSRAQRFRQLERPIDAVSHLFVDGAGRPNPFGGSTSPPGPGGTPAPGTPGNGSHDTVIDAASEVLPPRADDQP